MSGLPTISSKALLTALERAGFVPVKQRGSHLKLRHRESARVCVLPLHPTLAVGTLASVLRQAGLRADDLAALLEPKTGWPPPGHPWPPPPAGPWPPR